MAHNKRRDSPIQKSSHSSPIPSNATSNEQLPSLPSPSKKRFFIASVALLVLSALVGHPILLGSPLAGAATSDSGFVAIPSRGKVELNPSVMLLGDFDWTPYPDAPHKSRCIDGVTRASESGSSRVNFVPTQYWRDARGNGQISHFCTMDGGMNCREANIDRIRIFRTGLEACFRHAVDLGLGISVVPHLDDGSGGSAWRNGLVFSPRAKYGGFSYDDVLLRPVADAIAATRAHHTRVWLAMQGEMSATLMRYPREYTSLSKDLKDHICSKSGQKSNCHSIVKIGASFNFNKLERANTGGGFLGSRGISFFGRRSFFRSGSTPGVDFEGLKNLFESAIDFVGISSYPALTPSFSSQELQNSAFMFFSEFKSLGLDVAALISRKNLEFHYSEYGLGGGTSGGGTSAAKSASAAAHTPFFGVWGLYRRDRDPWQNKEVRDFMRSFYEQSLKWLDGGGGPTYHVHACFLWGMGSWDVLGIHPESTSREGGYRDPVVADWIRTHNLAARRAGGGERGGREADSGEEKKEGWVDPAKRL